MKKTEQAGKLQKGDTVADHSTGNTGTALVMVGAAKGYKVLIYMARGFNIERYKMIQAFNAEIHSLY